nr:isochorismate synthase, chloroplastic [Tanacetum cinerariifolium]
MTKLSEIRGDEMIMISKMRDKINPRKKRLNLEEAKGQEPRNRLDPICFFYGRKLTYFLSKSGYKWIFKKKRKADGTVDKYKARLVIKEFRQREGLDYFDTYSLVTRITSIRMILAIAACRNLEVHQIDVKKEFLNEDLKEEIYMNQPECFMGPGFESKSGGDHLNNYYMSTMIMEDIQLLSNDRVMMKSQSIMIQDEIAKHMLLMIHDEITYVRKKWGRFKRKCEGDAIPKSSCRTRSGCTTALDVVPWEIDGESVLRESC